MEEKILRHLKTHHSGRSRAAPSRALEVRFHLSGRKLRQAVNDLRCAGHPICSDENGYFYAETPQELEATIRQLLSRIGKIAEAKNGLVRAMALFPDAGGQISLPL